MAFDPSAISHIADGQPDLVGARARAYQLSDLMDQSQLRKMQINEAKQKSTDTEAVRNILKNADLSTFEGQQKAGAEITKINPGMGMDFMKETQGIQKGKNDLDLQQVQLLEAQQGLIVAAIDPIVGEARQMKQAGKDDATVTAFINSRLPAAITQLRDTKLPNGQSALSQDILKQVQTAGNVNLATLEGWESRSKAGQAALRQRLEQFKADTADRKLGETERHDRAMEGNAARRTDQAGERAAAGKFTDDEGALMAALAEKGVSLPTGFRSKDQQKALYSQLLARHPGMSPDDIADKVKDGKIDLNAAMKESSAAANVAGRVSGSAESLQELIPYALELSKKVPRGQFVPWNKLSQYASSQMSNPDLKRLKAVMTTIANDYDVIGGRGGTDMEKRKHNRELFDTADSPEALKAAFDAITQEADLTLKAYRKAEKVGRTEPTPGPASHGTPPQSGGAGPGAGTMPTATGPDGKKVKWNGSAWVPFNG